MTVKRRPRLRAGRSAHVLAAVAATLAAGAGPAHAATALPTTGFEQRAGASWTTLAEEQGFLGALDAGSDRVTVSEVGRSVRGRPIQLLTLGPARTRAEIAAGPAALFVCTQHGNEPAGREACLQLARNYAAGAEQQSVLVIPTANPDGVAATSRLNANGVDINRDHLRLNTPEARAVAAVIRDYKPDVLADLHEYSQAGAGTVLFQSPQQIHPDTDAAVAQLSNTLNSGYAAPAVRAAGFPTSNYQPQPDESIMQVMAGLSHTVGLLVETPRLGTLSTTRRVRAQQAAIGGVLKMLRERTDLASVTAGAALRATSEGAAGNQRYYFTTTSSTATPPCGYRLSETQYQGVQRTLGLHGISAVASGGAWRISMAQPAQPVIPLLLDSRATMEMTAGTPLAC